MQAGLSVVPRLGEDWRFLVVDDARLGLCEGSHALRTLRCWAAERERSALRWDVPVHRHSDGLWLPLQPVRSRTLSAMR